MKINRKKKSNKKLIVVIVMSCLAIIALSLWYARTNKYWLFADKNQSINYGPATKEEKKAGEDVKNSATTDQTKTTPTDPTTSTNPTDTSVKSVDMKITAANQDAGTLYIRTVIQTVATDGTCTLSMVGPSGKAYSASSPIQALPSTSTCAGFNVPVNSLATGKWSVTINFQSGSLKGSASQDVTVQ